MILTQSILSLKNKRSHVCLRFYRSIDRGKRDLDKSSGFQNDSLRQIASHKPLRHKHNFGHKQLSYNMKIDFRPAEDHG